MLYLNTTLLDKSNWKKDCGKNLTAMDLIIRKTTSNVWDVTSKEVQQIKTIIKTSSKGTSLQKKRWLSFRAMDGTRI